MTFYNRKNELAVLNRWWKEKKQNKEANAKMIVLYGKRRIGKTSLCLEFAKNKPYVYFLADKMNSLLQLKKFSKQIGEFYQDTYLIEFGFRDWEEAFSYLAKQKKKMVLIIDEFPYLVEADSSIPSVFQKGWDLYLKNSSIFLILCGSSIGMMEEHILSYKAPLFGRRTGQILVKPFSFFELYQIFPKYSFEKKLLVYSITGGIISYLNHFLRSNDIFKVIKEKILSKEEFLYQEVDFLLREELRQPQNYFSILRSIADGKRKLSEILNDCGLDKSTCTAYLGILNKLFITEREVPVTETIPSKSRLGYYRIIDNFFSFWFNFVFRYRNYIEEGKSDFVLKQIKSSANSLLAKNYEEFAKIYVKETMFDIYDTVNRWWDSNTEIDLIALNNTKKTILFGEVKWTNKPVGINILLGLKEKAKKVDWFNKNRIEKFILFSKNGFTEELIKVAKKEGVLLIWKDKKVGKN